MGAFSLDLWEQFAQNTAFFSLSFVTAWLQKQALGITRHGK